MRIVYSFNCYEHTEKLLQMCKVSKDLYNQALYECLQAMKQEPPKYYNVYRLCKIMPTIPNLEGTINYKLLKAQVAQQTLHTVTTAIKNYFKAIKDYNKNPSKYTGRPRMPQYKPKNSKYLLIYTNQACTINNQGYITLSRNKGNLLQLKIPEYNKYRNKLQTFQQVRIIPKDTYVKVDIVYNTNTTYTELNQNKYASIDLGINNLVTLVTDFSQPIIYNGKQIKSINQYFNKQLAHYQSILKKENNKYISNRITQLYTKRNNRINDLLHKVSRHIVNTLIKNKVGTLVCGRNKGWKDSVNLGKKTNQNFVLIPYEHLIDMLKYKCNLEGVRFIENEESYTSKCDSLAFEPIVKHEPYIGKRVKRGLFQSSIGKLLNADVNGALNILRKVVGDSPVKEIVNRGWLHQPRKLNNLYCLGF